MGKACHFDRSLINSIKLKKKDGKDRKTKYQLKSTLQKFDISVLHELITNNLMPYISICATTIAKTKRNQTIFEEINSGLWKVLRIVKYNTRARS